MMTLENLGVGQPCNRICDEAHYMYNHSLLVMPNVIIGGLIGAASPASTTETLRCVLTAVVNPVIPHLCKLHEFRPPLMIQKH